MADDTDILAAQKALVSAGVSRVSGYVEALTRGLYLCEAKEQMPEESLTDMDGFVVYQGLLHTDWSLTKDTAQLLDNIQYNLDVSLPVCLYPSDKGEADPWTDNLPSIDENTDPRDKMRWFSAYSGVLDELDYSSKKGVQYATEVWHASGPVTYNVQPLPENWAGGGDPAPNPAWNGTHFGAYGVSEADVKATSLTRYQFDDYEVCAYPLTVEPSGWGNWLITARDMAGTEIYQVVRVDGTHTTLYITYVTAPPASVEASTSYNISVKWYKYRVYWRLIDSNGVIYNEGTEASGWTVQGTGGTYNNLAVLSLSAAAEGTMIIQATDDPFYWSSRYPTYYTEATSAITLKWVVKLSTSVPLEYPESYNISVTGNSGDTTWQYKINGAGSWTTFAGDVNGINMTKTATQTATVSLGTYFRGKTLDIQVYDSKSGTPQTINDLSITLPNQFYVYDIYSQYYNAAELDDDVVRITGTLTSSGLLKSKQAIRAVTNLISSVGGVQTYESYVQKWSAGSWTTLTYFPTLTKTITTATTYVGDPTSVDYRRITTTYAGSAYSAQRSSTSTSSYYIPIQLNWGNFTQWNSDAWGNYGHLEDAGGTFECSCSWLLLTTSTTPVIEWDTDYVETTQSDGSIIYSGYMTEWIEYGDGDNYIVRMSDNYAPDYSTVVKYSGYTLGNLFEYEIAYTTLDLRAKVSNNYYKSNMYHGKE